MTTDEDGSVVNFSPIKLGILILISVLSTVFLCPLEVVASKLAIQRNHAAPEYNSVVQEVEDDDVIPDEYVEYAGVEEDVIGYVFSCIQYTASGSQAFELAFATRRIPTSVLLIV